MHIIWSVLILLFKSFCFFALFYQLLDTTRNYLKYDTLTSVEYELLSEVPAFMFCLPRLYPNFAIKQLLSQLENDTFDFYNNCQVNYTFDKERFDKFFMESNTDFCCGFSSCNLQKILRDSLQYFNYTFEVMLNYKGGSSRIFSHFRNPFYYVPGLKFYAYLNRSGSIAEFLHITRFGFKRCFLLLTNYNAKPLFDITIKGRENMTKEARKIQRIQVLIENVFYYNDSATFGIYSPNEVPNKQSELTVVLNRYNYQISYNLLKIERLPPPYKTMCKTYDIGEPSAKQSRYDCIAKCMFQVFSDQPIDQPNWALKQLHLLIGFINNYKNAHNFPYNDEILNETIFTDFGRLLSSSVIIKIRSLEDVCPKLCPVDCVLSSYSVKMSDAPHQNPIHAEMSIQVIYSHDDNLDVFVKHAPALDWITFLASVGGLGGMWVGFSFLAFPKKFSELYQWSMTRLCSRYNTRERLSQTNRIRFAAQNRIFTKAKERSRNN